MQIPDSPAAVSLSRCAPARWHDFGQTVTVPPGMGRRPPRVGGESEDLPVSKNADALPRAPPRRQLARTSPESQTNNLPGTAAHLVPHAPGDVATASATCYTLRRFRHLEDEQKHPTDATDIKDISHQQPRMPAGVRGGRPRHCSRHSLVADAATRLRRHRRRT